MPCRDSWATDPPYGSRAEQERTLEALRDQLNARTAMLCELCALYESELNKKLPGNIDKWWKQHQEFDRRRKAAAPKVGK